MLSSLRRTKVLYLILAVLLLCSVTPIIFISSQLISINSQTLEGKEKVYQVQTVRDKARQIELYVQGYVAQVGAYARAFEIGGSLPPTASRDGQDHLARTLEDDTNLIALAVAPRNGVSSFAANTRKISHEEMQALLGEAAAATAGGRAYLGEPRIIRSSLEPAFIVAHPVKRAGAVASSAAATEGVVMAVIGLQKVFGVVAQRGNLNEEELLRGEQAVFFVVDGEGRAVAHPDEQLAFRRQDMRYLKVVPEWMESNQLVAATASFALERAETLHLLGSYASAQLTPDKRLGVIGVVNEQAAYLSVGKMRRRTLIITLAVAFIVCVAGLVFARGISQPIELLATGARAIAAGDFTRRIALTTPSREISQLADDFNQMSDQLQQRLRELKESAERHRRLFFGSVKSLAAAIDGKDPYTRGHSERVMLYSTVIAEGMRLPAAEVEKIRISALLHDVGKIGVEDRILRKPAALTPPEFELMKRHPGIGALIMEENPEMAEYLPGMHMHHETLDGKGYPQGLKGDQIPTMARIVSVADCFDAMTTNRPYQRAMTFEDAVERINTFVGTRYDARVVVALEKAIRTGLIKPDPRFNNVPQPVVTRGPEGATEEAELAEQKRPEGFTRH
jgi:HD-GYP domain-containing protein (c-di-GMP phosphodiesterase class II)